MNRLHVTRLISFALASALAAALVASCAGGTTYASLARCGLGGCGAPSPSPSPSPTQASCVTPIQPANLEVIGVDLNINPCTDPTYQEVIGYFGGGTVANGEVMSVTHSATDVVQFQNLDNQPHTAADLGTWTGSYPQNGPDPSATPSPKGTDISSAGFTAGNLNPGQKSRKYIADVPGVYVFGCAYHYAPSPGGMRTIIIVQ